MPAPRVVDRRYDGEVHEEHPDRTIGVLADRQYGVVSRRQMEARGLTRTQLDRRLANGHLLPLHRGVYAVGHRIVPRNGRLLAAVLASGPGATLSHRSAAALWDLVREAPRRTDVTTHRALRQRETIHLHRASLSPDERMVRDGIPVTTPARTLLDLAAVLPRDRLERAANEAEVQRVYDGRALARLLERYPHRGGVPALRAVIADLALGARITDNEFEQRFLALLDASSLPRAEHNAWIGAGGTRYRIDAVWRAQRLAVEVDGRATHMTARRFETDRRRDIDLQREGWCVARFTWRRLRDDPRSVVADIRALLQAPRAVGAS